MIHIVYYTCSLLLYVCTLSYANHFIIMVHHGVLVASLGRCQLSTYDGGSYSGYLLRNGMAISVVLVIQLQR